MQLAASGALATFEQEESLQVFGCCVEATTRLLNGQLGIGEVLFQAHAGVACVLAILVDLFCKIHKLIRDLGQLLPESDAVLANGLMRLHECLPSVDEGARLCLGCCIRLGCPS